MNTIRNAQYIIACAGVDKYSARYVARLTALQTTLAALQHRNIAAECGLDIVKTWLT
jgi:hypothetical protein